MKEKLVKTPDQITEEKSEARRLAQEITARINRVPRSVIEGDVYKARDWKAKAFKAMQLAKRSPPKLDALRHAVDDLRCFE